MALGCCALWGANSAAVKFASPVVPPFFMAGLRFSIGFLATGLALKMARRPLDLGASQRPLVAINALFLFVQIGLFHWGTSLTSSIHSVILVNTFPFFTAIASHYWLPSYRLTWRQTAGLLTAFVGVLTMFGDHLTLPRAEQIVGDLILIVSAGFLGTKLVYVKSIVDRIDAGRIVFWEAVLSAPLFFLTSFLVEGVHRWTVTPTAFAAIVYQGAGVSGVAFLTWTMLLSRHSPNELSAFSFATPLFGVVAGSVFLSEPITGFLVAGGLMVAWGIGQVNRS